MNEVRLKKLLIYPGMVFLLLFCLVPIVWMLVVSFSKDPDFLALNVPFRFSLKNYLDVLTVPSVHLLQYLRNSLFVSLIAAVFATLFASLSAYAVTRLKYPGRMLIPVLLLALSMFPQISIVGYLFRLLTSLEWINTYPALIFPYITLGLPLALWIMLSHFAQIPIELDNAALVDGATRFQIIRKIIFPIALPGALSTLLLVFVYSFNEFLFALMFTINYKTRTIPVGIALFEGLHGQIPWGQIMASATIGIFPVLILAFIFQKKIIQGLMQGAVKG